MVFVFDSQSYYDFFNKVIYLAVQGYKIYMGKDKFESKMMNFFKFLI